MPDFLVTLAGRQYREATLPQHTKAMNRLAAAIERQNELAEAALDEVPNGNKD